MYFQTWMHVAKINKIPIIGRKIYKLIQLICELLIGHQNSKTEWQYDLISNKAMAWCRWCNKRRYISVDELSKNYENARTKIWEITNKDINIKGVK